MSQIIRILSPKLVHRSYYKPGEFTHAHWCPSCNQMHDYAVDQPFRNNARWSFSGNVVDPTFLPSMNISVGPTPSGKVFRCHYWLKLGEIEFLNDCTHALAGQTVALPNIPEQEILRWRANGAQINGL